jgi:uncharacterized protein YyaL (SSP411 family)
MLLLRLAALTGEPHYERVGAAVLRNMGGLLERAPLAFGHLLAVHWTSISPRRRRWSSQGRAHAEDTHALLDVVRERYQACADGSAP